MSILQTKDGIVGKFFDRLSTDYQFTSNNEDEQLCVYLLFEKHLKEQSRYAQHIALLPSTYDLPFMWTKDEIEALKGTGLYAIAERMKQQINEDYHRLESHINRAGTAWNFSNKNTFTIENFTWAMCTVWSRGITLKINGKVVKAIAPFFDMFNHDPDAKTRHSFDVSKGYLSVITTGPIVPGSQICLNYGAYSSTDSVRLRGFLTPGNPNESFIVQTHVPPTRGEYQKRLELLRLAPPEKYDPSKPHGGVNHSEAGVLMAGDFGVVGEFNLFEDKYNEALHRSLVIEKCKAEHLDSLGQQLKKNKEGNVDIELELDVLNALGEALASLRDNLAPHNDEKIHLLNITSDMEQGKVAMKLFTRQYQDKVGYVPKDTDDNDNKNTNDDDDDWGVSLKPKVSNKQAQKQTNNKQKNNKQSLTNTTTDDNSNNTTSSSSTSASSSATSSSTGMIPISSLKFSNAANDTHERRLQMINYIRNVERRILQSHLEKLADAKHTLRTIVLGEQENNSTATTGTEITN